ncbi:MAG: STAS domain-containing protein [Candidatus Riflebacteria bacterium]|nr:STAS domain-containing protein [Candidatus Riflebacteria bacterium]
MDTFSILEKEEDGIAVIVFDGYCAKEGGAALQKHTQGILHTEKNEIIIDFTNCSVISSPGMAALLEIVMEVVDDSKGKLYLIGLDKSKKQFLQMTGVLPFAETAASIGEACQRIRGKK